MVANIPRAVVSHPRVGKHLAFKGEYLHGVPPELLRLDWVELSGEDLQAPERVTLLVNTWLDHRPHDIEPFPTDCAAFRDIISRETRLQQVAVRLADELQLTPTALTADAKCPVLGWQLGRPGEDYTLEMPTPQEFWDGPGRKQGGRGGRGRGRGPGRGEAGALERGRGETAGRGDKSALDSSTIDITFRSGAKLTRSR